MSRSIRFYRTLNGVRCYIGTAIEHEPGWRFFTNVSSRGSSRKFHPTLERCVPRWARGAEREDYFPVRVEQ
jgi:hypothetical protein